MYLSFLFNYAFSFDDYVNLVLSEVTEYNNVGGKLVKTELPEILLNGNHVAIIVPGGSGPE